MDKSEKRGKLIGYLLGVLVFIGLGIGIYFFVIHKEATSLVASTPAPMVSQQGIVAVPTPTKDPRIGKVVSNLTGEWISKKTAKLRPYAIMINNIGYANANQKGTSQADIIYEALAEGGITRMMAVYQDPSKVKAIGSVRSARHYYVSFASEWDAIFCHFGHTHYALSKIVELSVDNISGLSSIGGVVYGRVSGYRPPHNVYTSGKRMIKGAKVLKYRRTVSKSKQADHFGFYQQDTDLSFTNSTQVDKITLPFSTYSTTYFIYNKNSKVYKKYEYKIKHMDQENHKQLAFKNIIVQYVEESNIDHNGYQTMEIGQSKGKGVYITNEKRIPITWKKNEVSGTMEYSYKNGDILKLNPGKTYIGVFPVGEKQSVIFKSSKN